ncbi:carbohydrate ABC transporter permease [Verrucosispora sp. WMMD573]|uniref:carbohydrate ABC transporter permease n=1 Tax=Verrucosispora sp. WMMD573 TaxID=3015149 RepID=UPI00248CC3B4|nr:carbohydrate ABC transporter permease [Verrucosispora sp. WMMD573]WBB54438.1 carbohydrate ABC transporter permease [Verrucosispora sp. WMMD573]
MTTTTMPSPPLGQAGPTGGNRRPNRRRTTITVVKYALVTLLAVGYLVPIYWILMTSFKSRTEAYEIPPRIFVAPDWTNYVAYLSQSRVVSFLTNSLVITGTSTLITMVLGVLAAYGLARLRPSGSATISFLFLSTRFVPPISTVVPLFLGLKALEVFDTRFSMIIIYSAMNIPYAVWMMHGFFQDLPVEVEEAAWVDGCSRLAALWRVVLPMSSGGLAATSVLVGMFAWNEFLYALMLTSREANTLPLSMTAFLGEQGTDWGGMAAAGTLIMIPALIFSIFVQKQMARGLSFGAVKG